MTYSQRLYDGKLRVRKVVPENGLDERFEFACDLARQVGREALRFWHERGSDNLGLSTAIEHICRRRRRSSVRHSGFVGAIEQIIAQI